MNRMNRVKITHTELAVIGFDTSLERGSSRTDTLSFTFRTGRRLSSELCSAGKSIE